MLLSTFSFIDNIDREGGNRLEGESKKKPLEKYQQKRFDEILQRHRYKSDSSDDTLIHYALTITFTQPSGKNRSDQEIEKFWFIFLMLLSENLIHRRARNRSNDCLIVSAIQGTSGQKHLHCLLSIDRKHEENAKRFCGKNSFKEMRGVKSKLPNLIKSTHFNKADNGYFECPTTGEIKWWSVKRWLDYCVRHYREWIIYKHLYTSLVLYSSDQPAKSSMI
jgi:hypothetical protein